MRKLQFAMVALFAALLAACATGYHDTRVVSTQTGVEKDPKGPYQSMVVGVLAAHELRGHLENAIVAKFAERGIKATAAHTVFGDKGIEGKNGECVVNLPATPPAPPGGVTPASSSCSHGSMLSREPESRKS